MNYIGIDPGITGAIAIIHDHGSELFDLPVMMKGNGKTKVKNEIDGSGLARILNNYNPKCSIVGIELVHAMPATNKSGKRVQGVATINSLGDSRGCIRGVCQAMGFQFEYIQPAKWKKYFKLNRDKETARSLAIRLFPSHDLHRKKDHNRAEALLIAKYLNETRFDNEKKANYG